MGKRDEKGTRCAQSGTKRIGPRCAVVINWPLKKGHEEGISLDLRLMRSKWTSWQSV